MNRLKIVASILVCIFLSGCAARTTSTPQLELDIKSGDLPISREAVIIENTSPTEVMVQAAGIGGNTEEAILDARRCSLWFVLIGCSDSLLHSTDEKIKFESVKNEFYSPLMVAQYISWESREIKSRLAFENGKKIKIVKIFKVNKGSLKNKLLQHKILKPQSEIINVVGFPMIMVIPDITKNDTPVEAMNRDPTLKHAAQVIESYLTNQKYDVQIPEQKRNIDALIQGVQAINNMEDDQSYQWALSIGSDIYLTFTIDIQSRDIGGSTVRKAIVGIRAYETTTGRLLGTETGYSQERPAADLVLIEEAILGAIDNVMNRVNSYWKDDISRGVQYKLVINIQGNYSSDDLDEIASNVSQVIKRICNYSKENIATKQTLDYLVWVDPQKITDSRDLYNILKQDFSTKQGKLRSVNINRKLILLKISE